MVEPMTTRTTYSRYRRQRPRRTPPTVRLRDVRLAHRLTLDEVRERIAALLPPGQTPPTRGALSAVENGHRGVSAELADLLASVYGLPPGAILTDYEKHRRPTREAA